MLIWASMIGLTIFWNDLSLILSEFWSSWVCRWTAWRLLPPGMIICKYLDTQFRTYLSSDLVVGVLLNRWSCRLSLPVYCWTDCRIRDIFLSLGESAALVDEDATVVIVFFRHELQWRRDPRLMLRRDPHLLLGRDSHLVLKRDSHLMLRHNSGNSPFVTNKY